VDTGLANIAGFQFSANSGKLAENIVFLELKRRSYSNPHLEIYYWKNLAQEEVDFAVKEKTSVKELIQVCWNVRDARTKKRETRALLKAMEEFELDEGTIITEDCESEESVGGKTIKTIPLYKWLLG